MIEWLALILAIIALYRTVVIDRALVRHLLTIYKALGRLKGVRD